LLDPLTRQGLRKRYQAGQSEMCASFLTVLPVALTCLLVILTSVIYTGLSEERVSNLWAGSIAFCLLSDQASDVPLGFVDVYSAFRRQAPLLQLSTR
jgi:hypothetical protein